jgi:hypothetical protein
MKPIPSALSWPCLLLLGIASGILSVASPFSGRWGPFLYVGAVYGAMLGVYFVFCRSERSAKNLSLLVLASAVAYPIAFHGSGFGLFLQLPLLRIVPWSSEQGEAPLTFILTGGVLGGFALLLPIFVLFGSSPSDRKVVLIRVAVGSLLSGAVGVLAWGLGPLLGEEIWLLLPWTLLPNAPIQSPWTFHLIALYLVWQPIMALYIGAVVSWKPPPMTESDSLETAAVP